MSAYTPQVYMAISILAAAVIIVLYEIWLAIMRPPIDINAVAFQQLLDLFIRMTEDDSPTQYQLEDVMKHAKSALYALKRSRAKINVERKIDFYKGLLKLLTKIEHRYGSGRSQARQCLRMINSVRKLTTPSGLQRLRSASLSAREVRLPTQE